MYFKKKISSLLLTFLVLCSCNASLCRAGNDSVISILDGGTGREIERRGLPFGQPEWSAKILLSGEPQHLESLKNIHLSFINSGAEIITTNSYALVPSRIGMDKFLKDGQELVSKSVNVAYDAKMESGKGYVKIAASIPPIFASYRPDLFEKDEAIKLYPIIIDEFVKNSKVDILLAETISSIEEADTITSILTSKTKKPYWLSFTIDEKRGNLRSGEKIEDIKSLIKKYDNLPQAILFNCSRPEIMNQAVRRLHKLDLGIRIGVCANLFVEKNDYTQSQKKIAKLEKLSVHKYASYANLWIDSGATIVGGCCGVGTEYIKRLYDLKQERKAKK